MDKTENTIELLAPAGDWQTAIGALNAGADAVYLGAPLFSARAYATNLTTEEIVSVLQYAHLHRKKVYLAMNILMKNRELPQAAELIRPLYRAGLDGIIVQDLGLLSILKKTFPSLELHASTQMAILSKEGAAWIGKKGCSRVVPGRELSLDEIRKIKESGLEVECFIHGAMCYSYSGRCLMSSLAGGRSGNRGRCAGPCRKCYEIKAPERMEGKKGYFLSMKDMCALPVLKELTEIPVDSLKIEGRMKDPAYAAGVSEVYRRNLGSLLPEQGLKKSASEKGKKAEVLQSSLQLCQGPDTLSQKRRQGSDTLSLQLRQDLDTLSSLYIRSSVQTGYFHQQNGKNMVTIDSPSYRSMDEETRKTLHEKYVSRVERVKVDMAVNVWAGCPVLLSLTYGEITVYAEGEPAQTAVKKALSPEDIEKQVRRLGDSFFEVGNLEISTDEASFVPVKALNQLRRDAVSLLEQKVFVQRTDAVPGKLVFDSLHSSAETANSSSDNKSEAQTEIEPVSEPRKGAETASEASVSAAMYEKFQASEPDALCENPYEFGTAAKKDKIADMLCWDELKIQAETVPQAEAAYELGLRRFVLPLSLLEEQDGDIIGLLDRPDCELFLRLPEIIRENRFAQVKAELEGAAKRIGSRFAGVYCSSIDALSLAEQLFPRERLLSDHSLAVFNQWSEEEILSHVAIYTASYELNEKELHFFRQKQARETVLYGRQDVMHSANCIYKTAGACNRKEGAALLADESGRQFPVLPRHRYCYNTVFNCVPLSLHSYALNGKNKLESGFYRLNFTIESPEEVKNVLSFYRAVLSGGQAAKPDFAYTTGHLKRGVE